MERVNHRQGIPEVAGGFYPRWRTVLHFIAGLIFMLIFWPLGLVYVGLRNLTSCLMRNPPEKHRAIGQRTLGRAFDVCIRGLIGLGIIKIDDSALAANPPVQGPVIVASNHPAIWDALLIMRHCRQVSCIMKASLLSNPLLRCGALFAGFLPNAPQKKMLRSAIDRLADGGQLLLFPEGTRTKDENHPLNPFYPGMALIACKSQAPLLPVFIQTNSPYLQKGWPIWKMPDFPIRIHIGVGKRLQAEPGEKARDFSDRMEAVFRKHLR